MTTTAAPRPQSRSNTSKNSLSNATRRPSRKPSSMNAGEAYEQAVRVIKVAPPDLQLPAWKRLGEILGVDTLAPAVRAEA